MAQLKKIGMAAGTFSVALGIGFVMQNGDALASRFGTGETADVRPFTVEDETPVQVVQASLTSDVDLTSDAPTNAEIVAVASTNPMEEAAIADVAETDIADEAPALMEPDLVNQIAVTVPADMRVPDLGETPLQLASIERDPAPLLSELGVAETATVEVDCVPEMMAAPLAGAMVEIAVVAPCHTDASFTIHHQGMMFNAMTTETGTAKITVPALSATAVIIAAFDNGDGAVATAQVPDFAAFDRAVLQWQGAADVSLSAYEGGAAFGDANHIHGDNPGDMDRLTASEGGYLMRLGDATVENGLMAEVYTFPTGTVVGDMDVLLVAEAAITDQNCGNELSAQSIQVGPDGVASALDLTMVMPDCDAVGDFLILQNMFEDLTLAAR